MRNKNDRELRVERFLLARKKVTLESNKKQKISVATYFRVL